MIPRVATPGLIVSFALALERGAGNQRGGFGDSDGSGAWENNEFDETRQIFI
jgi:hypothetical protein